MSPEPQDYRKLKQHQRRALRNDYVAAQAGLCRHCQWPLDGSPAPSVTSKAVRWELFPGGRDFLRHPVHLHHCHKTGKTLGAVHAYCNAVLWQYHGE